MRFYFIKIFKIIQINSYSTLYVLVLAKIIWIILLHLPVKRYSDNSNSTYIEIINVIFISFIFWGLKQFKNDFKIIRFIRIRKKALKLSLFLILILTYRNGININGIQNLFKNSNSIAELKRRKKRILSTLKIHYKSKILNEYWMNTDSFDMQTISLGKT